MPAQHCLVMQSSRALSAEPGRVPSTIKPATRFATPAHSGLTSCAGVLRTAIRSIPRVMSMTLTRFSAVPVTNPAASCIAAVATACPVSQVRASERVRASRSNQYLLDS